MKLASLIFDFYTGHQTYVLSTLTIRCQVYMT
jgi:hypothetical protein